MHFKKPHKTVKVFALVNEAQLAKITNRLHMLYACAWYCDLATRQSIQGPVASVMQRAVLCWLASCTPQLLQICLLSAPRSPSKCWVSNEKAAQSSRGALMKRNKRGENERERGETQQRREPILLLESLNMKILCSVLQRYLLLFAFKVTVNC